MILCNAVLTSHQSREFAIQGATWMYNRSERKQTYLNKQTLNPRLGPGENTPKTLYPLAAGKTRGFQSKVPFLAKSLLPRTPETELSPTTYQIKGQLETSQVPVFKPQKHSRFPDTTPLQVSPNAYTLASTLQGTRIPEIHSTLHKVFVGVLDKKPVVNEDREVEWQAVKTIPSIPYPDHGFVSSAAKAAHVVLEENSETTHHATTQQPVKRDKGFLFPKATKALQFAITDSPGPLYYESVEAERALFYKTADNALGDVHFRRNIRLIESTIAETIKEGVPGVGMYDIQSTNESAKFSIPRASRDAPQTVNPSPQQYSKITAWTSKTQSKSLYDTPNDRFIDKPDGQRPDPGSYKAATLYEDVMRKASMRPEDIRYGFGSIVSRFQTPEKQVTPSPGAYHRVSTPPLSSKRRDLLESLDSPPVFGCTDERFTRNRTKTPSPSAYRPGESFHQVQSHGKLIKNLSVGNRHHKVKNLNQPSPCLYTIKGEEIKTFDSVFKSNVPRFETQTRELVPSPNTYQLHDDIVKGTFNISLGKDGGW